MGPVLNWILKTCIVLFGAFVAEAVKRLYRTVRRNFILKRQFQGPRPTSFFLGQRFTGSICAF